MPRLIRPPKKSKVVLASEDAVLYLERDDRISLRFIKKATSIAVYQHSTQSCKLTCSCPVLFRPEDGRRACS